MRWWDATAARILDEFETRADFLRAPATRGALHPDERKIEQHFWNVTRGWRELPPDRAFGTPQLATVSLPGEAAPRQVQQSLLTLQHAYYLRLIEERLGLRVEEIASVLEIGGGYGNMARLMRDLGFTGTYRIADLPPMLEVQRGYLQETTGLHRMCFGSVEQAMPEELCIATFSYGEFPLDERGAVEPVLAACPFLFIAYHAEFQGIDNAAWFEGLSERLPHKTETLIDERRDSRRYLLAWNE